MTTTTTTSDHDGTGGAFPRSPKISQEISPDQNGDTEMTKSTDHIGWNYDDADGWTHCGRRSWYDDDDDEQVCSKCSASFSWDDDADVPVRRIDVSLDILTRPDQLG